MMQFVADRPGHDFKYSLSCDKIHCLGWKPQVEFEKGLRKTIDWYIANEWWGRRLVTSLVRYTWRRLNDLPARLGSNYRIMLKDFKDKHYRLR